jgi:hypothetical protein
VTSVRRARAARGAAVALIALLFGCKGGGHASSSGSSPTAVPAIDAGAATRDAGPPVVVDAAPPPDDGMLPAPSEELVVRARHLIEAIARDDASLAGDILFPRDGWVATRDAPDPGKDWDARASAPFRRAVHALSRRHRGLESLDHAQVVSLELGGALVQATPRKHGWKRALWTVAGSRLTFVVAGHTRTLPIREMVAWRGAWYVTRLR